MNEIFNSLESNVRAYCREVPNRFESGAGCYLYDSSGTPYLDFLAGSGSLNYGHNDPCMREALVSYISSNGLAMGLDFHSSAKAEFLHSFQDRILNPRSLDYKVQFSGPTGTNSIEAALKLARKYTGRNKVVSFTNGFHGCTLGALAVTGNLSVRGSSEDLLSHVYRLPYDGYIDDKFDSSVLLKKLMSDPSSGLGDIGAIILEVVQGEGGINVASKGWVQEIQNIARENDLLLIVDEIQSGCGRTGDFFAFESLGIDPDIIALSKSISGFGLPMSLLLMKPEIDIWSPAEHSGTFRGNSHAFVTAKVALEKFWLDDAFTNRINDTSRILHNELHDIEKDFGFKAKGRGLMCGIDVGSSEVASLVKKECYEEKLIIETCGPRGEVIKLLPPLTIGHDDLKQGTDILKSSLCKAQNKRVS